MDSVAIGQIVKNARELKGWSQEQLGEQAGGVGQSTIGRIEAGDFKRMPSDLPALCHALGIAMPDFNGRPVVTAGPLPRLVTGNRDFPIYASAEGGPGEVIRSSEAMEWAPRPEPLIHVKSAYGIIISGTSMQPEYRPGDTALVNPLLPLIGGEVYIFYREMEGEARATIKELRRQGSDAWHVRQHNPPEGRKHDFTLPRKEWSICHRVIGKFSRQ